MDTLNLIDRSLTIEDIKSVLAAALLTPDTISAALELLLEPKEDCHSNNFSGHTTDDYTGLQYKRTHQYNVNRSYDTLNLNIFMVCTQRHNSLSISSDVYERRTLEQCPVVITRQHTHTCVALFG